jgi:very-short-patch-repair endonuclease
MAETRADRRALMNRDHARELRNNSTKAERWLWNGLGPLRTEGLRFRRQQTIGGYIVDFFCASRKLVVELDGAQHFEPEAAAYDEERTRWLEQRGYTVLRFENAEVLKERYVVIDRILAVCKTLVVESEGEPLPEKREERFSTLPQGEGLKELQPRDRPPQSLQPHFQLLRILGEADADEFV